MSEQSISVKEAVALGAKNIIDFGRIFFPKTFRQSSPDFHYAISDALLALERQVAIEVFRDGAKTTLLRTCLAHRISYGISRTILVVSASQGHSILTLRWIKRQIETNTRWATTFGLAKGSKWTDEVIEVFHAVENVTITILALGITGQLRGFNIDDFRPDFILADDVSTDEMSKTLEQRKKFEDLFFGALLNSLAPASEAPLAKIVLLDTPKNKFDLIESCADREDWKFLRYGIFDDEGNSRWESRYPTAELKATKAAFIKSGQIVLWMKEKECKIIASELASFNVDNLKFYEEIPSGLMVVISIDPASSDSKDADDQVIMVLGFKGADVYVLDYTATKGEMPDRACVTLFEFIRIYRPIAIVSESISYQRVLAWYIEQEMFKRRTFVSVHREQDKRAKADRIVQQLGGLSAFGKLHVRSTQTALITQFSEYSPTYRGHDDILDALAMGVYWAEHRGIASFIEGEYSVELEDESEYKSLEFRSCP